MSDVAEIQVVEDDAELEAQRGLDILDETMAAEVMATLKEEYDMASTEMEARNNKIILWRNNMEALANNAPKNHPFKNASNVTVPVTQTITQTIAAKVKGTFDARDPLWTVGSLRADETEQNKIKVIEKYLNLLAKSPNDLDMQAVIADLVDETVLTGGSFAKVGYDIQSWKVKSNDGGEGSEVISHDGPLVSVLPLENVKYRRGVSSISRLPWVALDMPITEVELKERASKGIYDVAAVEKVLANKRTSPTDTEEQQQRAETFDSGETMALFDISEVWVYWDVDGDGVPVDLFLTVHFESQTILKQQYNSLGSRFLVNAKYVHRARALAGRGTGQMTESAQSEVTSIHNLRNDNMKIANMKIIAVKKATGFGAKREMYPGAMWEFDNPREDINAVPLGDIYPSSLQAEGQGMQYGMRATGLSETQMGFADSTLGTRDTASGQAMRMQTGDSILGSVQSGLRNAIGQIGMLVWMQCVANKERVIAREKTSMRLSAEDQATLAGALNMPIGEVPMRLGFTVRTTESDRTYEQQRMNMLSMTQIYAQFAKETIPLAMQLYGPQGQQMKAAAPEMWNYMARIMVGSSKLVEQIFKFFGIYDVGNYVPSSDQMDKMLDMMQGMVGAFQGAPQIQAPPAAQMPMQGGQIGMNGGMQNEGAGGLGGV